MPSVSCLVSCARTVLAALALLFLAACGGDLDGTYADPSGAMALEFRSGGEVRQSTMGMTMAGTYAVDGDEVVVEFNNRRMVFQREGNRLTNGMIALTKQDE